MFEGSCYCSGHAEHGIGIDSSVENETVVNWPVMHVRRWVLLSTMSAVSCHRTSSSSPNAAPHEESKPPSSSSVASTAHPVASADPPAVASAEALSSTPVEVTGSGEMSCAYLPGHINGGKEEAACDFYVRPALALSPALPPGKKLHEVLSFDKRMTPRILVPDIGSCMGRIDFIVQPTFEYLSLKVSGPQPGCDANYVSMFSAKFAREAPGVDAIVRGTYLGKPTDIHVKLAGKPH